MSERTLHHLVFRVIDGHDGPKNEPRATFCYVAYVAIAAVDLNLVIMAERLKLQKKYDTFNVDFMFDCNGHVAACGSPTVYR